MISENDCKTILNKLQIKNAIFKSYKMAPISKETEGFMGDHYKLIINYEVNNILKHKQFFIKTKPKNPVQDKLTKELGMFNREVFAYDVLLKEFEKYGYATDFASASYLNRAETGIVLEDLSLGGYSITERHEVFSLEHVKCALDALASFHAAGYAYQHVKTMELNTIARHPQFRFEQQYPESLQESFFVQYIDPDSFAMNWWTGSRTTILKLLNLLENDARFPDFKTYYDNFKFGQVFAQNLGINKTCGHGDLWSNNLMFKYENNKPVKCRLLDFQLTRCFYPSLDVILLIFSNTNREFRRKHLEYLYKYYFDTFSNFMRVYNCPVDEIHPWEHFLHSIEIVMPDALTQVLLVYCIVNLPVTKVSNLINENNDGINNLMFNNSELVVDTFVNDEVYRNKLMEVLEDFYKVLTKV